MGECNTRGKHSKIIMILYFQNLKKRIIKKKKEKEYCINKFMGFSFPMRYTIIQMIFTY